MRGYPSGIIFSNFVTSIRNIENRHGGTSRSNCSFPAFLINSPVPINPNQYFFHLLIQTQMDIVKKKRIDRGYILHLTWSNSWFSVLWIIIGLCISKILEPYLMKDRADCVLVGAKDPSRKVTIKFNALAINFTNYFNSEGYIVLSKDWLLRPETLYGRGVHQLCTYN